MGGDKRVARGFGCINDIVQQRIDVLLTALLIRPGR